MDHFSINHLFFPDAKFQEFLVYPDMATLADTRRWGCQLLTILVPSRICLQGIQNPPFFSEDFRDNEETYKHIGYSQNKKRG